MAGKVIQLVNGLPTMVSISSILTPAYDASIYYSTGLAASTAITLPSSGSFQSSTAADILVILNDMVVEVTRDFAVVGTAPYTQITFNYALPNDAVVRFKSHLG